MLCPEELCWWHQCIHSSLCLAIALSCCHCGVAGRQWWVTSGVFYLQDPQRGALTQSPGLSHLSQGTRPWQKPLAVSEVLERRWAWSTPWQAPIPAMHLGALEPLQTSQPYQGNSLGSLSQAAGQRRVAAEAFRPWGSIKKGHSCPFTSLCYWNKTVFFQWSKPSASSLLRQNWELG